MDQSAQRRSADLLQCQAQVLANTQTNPAHTAHSRHRDLGQVSDLPASMQRAKPQLAPQNPTRAAPWLADSAVMFLLHPHHTGWPQQSMQNNWQTGWQSDSTCFAFDIHNLVLCTSNLQGSWIAVMAAGHYRMMLCGILLQKNVSRCCMGST
jgi:hypothetical protein